MNSSKLMIRVIDKITNFVKWLALVGIGVFLALSLLWGVASCVKGIAEDVKYSQQNPWPQRSMQYIEFDGHEYVMLKGGGDASSGITHSPKCQCLQKEEP